MSTAVRTRSGLVCVLGPLLGACTVVPPEDIGGDWEPGSVEWEVAWADDFDGAAGTVPSPEYWQREVGGHGWGNNELQYYTDRPDNASLDGSGQLLIVAQREAFNGRDFTSARLKTDGLVEHRYGRFEARLKLPHGKGLWPAFWLLGANIDEVGWPDCGEVDIMELRGSEPHVVGGSLHGPGYSGSNPLTRDFELPSGTFNDDFHVFAFEWSRAGMRWLVDEQVYHARNRADMEATSHAWVYDQPFFILLNVAVGGNYDGAPDASTVFPQQMVVDYVRVLKPKR